MKTIAQEKGATVNQIILAWMLHSDPFVLPLIAASTEEHLKENLLALEISLTADELQRLDQAGG